MYLFDTEVEKVEPKDVVNVLLKIQADGEMNIDEVIEEMACIDRPDNRYIIISDWITEADKENLRRFSRYAPRTKQILVPPAGDENYQWVQMLKKMGHVAYARDVA